MSRRSARTRAMQLIFELGFREEPSSQSENRSFFKNVPHSPFCDELFEGTLLHWDMINDAISRYLKNWELDRLASVDLSILRLATYELLYCEETPLATVINEAVEMAKRFSNQDSFSFINGVLDQIAKERNAPHAQVS